MGLNGFPSSLWQVRRQAGRQTGALTLPKKGSSSAKPEELGQEQARTLSPPSPPHPTPAGNLGSGGAGSAPQTSGLGWDQKLPGASAWAPGGRQWARTPKVQGVPPRGTVPGPQPSSTRG